MIRIPLFLIAVALATWASPAQAEILFTRQLNVDRETHNFDINTFDLDIGFSDEAFAPTNFAWLFDDLIISPSNIGDTFVATATDPAFLTAVERLEDSTNGFIHTYLTEAEDGGLTESQSSPESTFFLFGSPTSLPDPAESTITSFSLRIDEFILLPSGPLGANDQLDLTLTFTIYGTLDTEPVPEPSTGWLFVCGLATLSSRLLIRRRSPQLAKAATL